MLWIILGSILITSFISGILGMAGGMILIGVLTLILPISTAMILHGITQMGSNGFRAFLLKEHIRFKVLPTYIIGVLLGFSIFSLLSVVPSKSFLLIVVGVFSLIAVSIPKTFSIDILKPRNSFFCGLAIITIQILAGASGPVLDVFFINSALDKREILATKAITQTFGHFFKFIYYVQILYFSSSIYLDLSYFIFPLAVVSAFIGTRLGKVVFDKLSEVKFRKYSRIVIGGIGILYIAKGMSVYFQN